MICQQVMRGSHHPTHRGTKSPIDAYEPTVVAMCVQMGQIRQPLNCMEGVLLMKDLIRGMDAKATLAKFQHKHKVAADTFLYRTLT